MSDASHQAGSGREGSTNMLIGAIIRIVVRLLRSRNNQTTTPSQNGQGRETEQYGR
jgi:hypothetical protein